MAGHELDAEKLGLERDPRLGSDRPATARRWRAAVWPVLAAMAAIGVWALARVGSWTAPPPEARPPLELKARESNGDVVVSWNKNAAAVRDAARASFTIIDGDQENHEELDLGTLRDGSVVYTHAVTPSVTFRLTVVSRRGESTSESVHIQLKNWPRPPRPPGPSVPTL
jgi:hypothetical protein